MTPSLRQKILPWFVCALGAIFYSYEYLLRMSPSVMHLDLMRFYNLTGTEYGYLSGSFYYIIYVPMQILVGLLMDRFGPRRLLTLACLFCVVGAYLFACSNYFSLAITGRLFIGFGSAFAFVGATKIATIWLPPKRFALVSGLIFCLGMLGAMFGDTVLRLLVDTFGWQKSIFMSAGAGLMIAAILWFVVRDKNPNQLVMTSHQAQSFRDVMQGLMEALKSSQIWLCGMVGCLLYLFLSVFAEQWAPAFLEQAHHLARVDAANATSMVFLGCALGAPFWGWFSDFLKLRRTPIIIASVGAFVAISALLYVHHLLLNEIYFLLFIFGFFSSSQILVFAVAREVTSINISGTAVGLLNMLVMVGGIFIPPAIGKILDLQWTGSMVDGARVYSAHAFMVSLSILPIAILFAIGILFRVRETHCAIQVSDAAVEGLSAAELVTR